MKLPLHLFAAIAATAIGLSACDYGGYEPNDPARLVPRTVDEDASLPSINVNGTKLHADGGPVDAGLAARVERQATAGGRLDRHRHRALRGRVDRGRRPGVLRHDRRTAW